MRIAFSGSHRVGKTTLMDRVAEALPRYATVDEPYDLLEAEGYEFAEPPSLDDFEVQLESSLEVSSGGEPEVLFDRCPIDILAYLLVHDDAARFDVDDWKERIHEAMQNIELVVFVPGDAATMWTNNGVGWLARTSDARAAESAHNAVAKQ